MIDTHVHLNHDDLAADLPGVLARAQAAGVGQFVVIGYDLLSSERAVRLAESDARIFATVGIHPHDALAWQQGSIQDRLRELVVHPRVVAVGEIGLDFYRDLCPRDAQDEAFRGQIALAKAANLPLVIHCRDAYDETLTTLDKHAPGAAVILHCFLGTRAHAAHAHAHGWFLGVGGAATFKKAEDLRAIVRDAPGESLLLETDAPYLSPEPLRGRYPNEPARVAVIAEAVAQWRSTNAATIAALTTANARRAFARLAAS